MRKLCTVALALVIPVVLLSAGVAQEMKAPTKAVCVIHPIGDSKVHGKIVFMQEGDKVVIRGEVTGLKPGAHGFHVHEFGDCSSPKGMSAGGHFNPDGEKHGGPHSKMRHVGDLGNIEADASGTAMVNITDSQVQLHGAHSVIGRSIIVHAKADDLKSQPAGDAGDRIGCGVIGIANAKEK